MISLPEDIPAEVWDAVVEIWPSFQADRLVYHKRRELLTPIEELASVSAENSKFPDPDLQRAWDECLSLFPDKKSWHRHHSKRYWIWYNPRVRGDLYPENATWL